MKYLWVHPTEQRTSHHFFQIKKPRQGELPNLPSPGSYNQLMSIYLPTTRSGSCQARSESSGMCSVHVQEHMWLCGIWSLALEVWTWVLPYCVSLETLISLWSHFSTAKGVTPILQDMLRDFKLLPKHQVRRPRKRQSLLYLYTIHNPLPKGLSLPRMLFPSTLSSLTPIWWMGKLRGSEGPSDKPKAASWRTDKPGQEQSLLNSSGV